MTSDCKANKLLVVDVEGVGCPSNIGAIMWNVETNERVERVVHIPKHLRAAFGTAVPERKVESYDVPEYRAVQQQLMEVRQMAVDCDFVLAHNATFARRMVAAIDELRAVHAKNWLCSMHDFPWPNGLSRKESLDNVCKRLDVPCEGARHGLAACQLLVACMQAVHELPARLMQAVHYHWFRLARRRRKIALP